MLLQSYTHFLSGCGLIIFPRAQTLFTSYPPCCPNEKRITYQHRLSITKLFPNRLLIEPPPYKNIRKKRKLRRKLLAAWQRMAENICKPRFLCFDVFGAQPKTFSENFHKYACRAGNGAGGPACRSTDRHESSRIRSKPMPGQRSK